MSDKKEQELFSKYTPSSIGGDRNPLRNVPGCYVIVDRESGSLYVGSTQSLADRSSKNVSALKHNKHKNKPLQELYNKNQDVEVFVEPTESIEEAQHLEQTVVNYFRDSELLCNVAIDDVTKTRIGVQVSEEVKQKIADSNRGQKRSEEAKRNMSEAQKAFLVSANGQKRLAEMTQKVSRSVIIDGICYPSISDASRKLNIPYTTLVRKYNL